MMENYVRHLLVSDPDRTGRHGLGRGSSRRLCSLSQGTPAGIAAMGREPVAGLSQRS
jgi:hypothetical protein